MPDRTHWAIVSLHLSAVLYVLLGALLALVPLAWDPASTEDYTLRSMLMWGLAAFSVLLAVGVEVVVRGLHKRRHWAWIAGIVVFALYVPSLFLPLGIIGLTGLLSEGTRARFPVSRTAGVRRAA